MVILIQNHNIARRLLNRNPAGVVESPWFVHVAESSEGRNRTKLSCLRGYVYHAYPMHTPFCNKDEIAAGRQRPRTSNLIHLHGVFEERLDSIRRRTRKTRLRGARGPTRRMRRLQSFLVEK